MLPGVERCGVARDAGRLNPTHIRGMQRRREEGRAHLHAVLAARPPFDGPALLRFLASRAIAGLEAVRGDTYGRSLHVDGHDGWLTVTLRAEENAGLEVTIHGLDESSHSPVLARLRHQFDLDADPVAIGDGLARDPLLASLVTQRPGLRVPRAWDGFELGVRAILGQQISVSAATRLASRLVASFGTSMAPEAVNRDFGLTHLFPAPASLVDADISLALNMPRSRGHAIRSFAKAVVDEPDLLSRHQELNHAVARLKTLPGIGEWTAQYIAMRALGQSDAMPAGDIGLLRALDEGNGRPSSAGLLARSEFWRPWRAYAVMHLWAKDSAEEARRDLKTRAGMSQ